MTDFQHTQSDPHGSHRKMLHVLLTHLPPRCALTFFPAPKGQAVKRLRAPPSKALKEQRYYQGGRESEYIYSDSLLPWLHLPMTPVWIELRVLVVRHQTIYF